VYNTIDNAGLGSSKERGFIMVMGSDGVQRISIDITYVPESRNGFLIVEEHYIAEFEGDRVEAESEYEVVRNLFELLDVELSYGIIRDAIVQKNRIGYSYKAMQRILDSANAEAIVEEKGRVEAVIEDALIEIIREKVFDIPNANHWFHYESYNKRIVLEPVTEYNRSYRNGRRRVFNHKSFPMRKDGSFNWEKIRESIQQRVDHAERCAKKEAEKKTQEQAAADFKVIVDVKIADRLGSSGGVTKIVRPVGTEIQVKFNIPLEKLTDVFHHLQELGIDLEPEFP